jgi:phosphatidylserine decarboxylase
MDRTNSGTSSASNNNSSETTPPIDDEETRQVQAAFSDMIDQTCLHGAAADGNIFEHTYVPQDWYKFFFRSVVPTQETVKHHLEHELPQQAFKHDDQEGVKYSFKVFDRRTGRLTYEQMPAYHKYGMRLLFSGPVQRELLNTSAIKSFFARETIRLGKAFDDPKSRKHIPSFVKMYQINLNELLYPNISDYSTFNEFFYRKLKPDGRPIDNRNDPNIIISAADCRLILFDNINDATRIWIKGTYFSLRHLFDDDKLADEFDGGSIAVFRLAPVDYHRFHSPISGQIGPQMKKITGTYYTVNPIAIKENLDVLTRNQRTAITIESEAYEKTAFVAIGALLVGSVNFTVQTNQIIEKGDELGNIKKKSFMLLRNSFFSSSIGYFAYGGSTVVVVFKAGMVKWNDDIKHNSDNSMETLVRVGEQIGQRRSDEQRREYVANISKTDKKNATISQLFTHLPSPNNIK